MVDTARVKHEMRPISLMAWFARLLPGLVIVGSLCWWTMALILRLLGHGLPVQSFLCLLPGMVAGALVGSYLRRPTRRKVEISDKEEFVGRLDQLFTRWRLLRTMTSNDILSYQYDNSNRLIQAFCSDYVIVRFEGQTADVFASGLVIRGVEKNLREYQWRKARA